MSQSTDSEGYGAGAGDPTGPVAPAGADAQAAQTTQTPQTPQTTPIAPDAVAATTATALAPVAARGPSLVAPTLIGATLLAADAPAPPSPLPGARRTSGARLAAVFDRLTTRAVSLYGTAVLRIGYGTAYLIFLLHEYPSHDALWGPDAPWSPALNERFAGDPGLDWFSVDRWWYTFLGHGGRTWFEFWYHVAILVSLLFALGVRTRLTSVLFALTIMTFTGRDVYLTDGGDNIMGLMAIYLAFTACGCRWSWDARRERRRMAKGIPVFSWPDTPFGRVLAELGDTRRRIVTFTHNTAVLVISAQICVVYAAAGLYKAQGSMWQNGTALYYALHLDWFRPWPALSDFLAGQSVGIAILAYVTVLVQIAFPFAVFSRWLKYPSLVILVGMHASIAVGLGLPLFSVAMMVGDAVFIPDRIWIRIGAVAGRYGRRLRDRVPRPAFPSRPRPADQETSALPSR